MEEEDTSYVIMYSGKNVFESYNKKTKSKGGEFSSFYNNFLENFLDSETGMCVHGLEIYGLGMPYALKKYQKGFENA
ncbi:MAG: hypothetical protein K2W92_03200 [Alphaproteobacteria bacterium]|nr:hypothetical protein [Alphaproteobacteria bacterium]